MGLPRDYCIETALAQDDIDDPFAPHPDERCCSGEYALFNKREVIRRQLEKMVSARHMAPWCFGMY